MQSKAKPDLISMNGTESVPTVTFWHKKGLTNSFRTRFIEVGEWISTGFSTLEAEHRGTTVHS
jgi:hypothetical protein